MKNIKNSGRSIRQKFPKLTALISGSGSLPNKKDKAGYQTSVDRELARHSRIIEEAKKIYID